MTAPLPAAGPAAAPAVRPPLPWWGTAALAVLLAALAYLPAALGAGFLGFDDPFYFGPQNQVFQDGLGAVWDPSRPIANAWLPVAHTSLWLDWWLGGGGPLLPHLTALLLHGLAGAALARLLLHLAVPHAVAHLAGAALVLHPALAESVAWVSGRKDLLSGLFALLALQQVVAYVRAPRPAALGLAALATALAMYSKATAVVLPLLALLVGAAAAGPGRRLLAAAVVALVAAPIAWHHQAIAAAEGTLAAGSLAERLPQAPGALWHYTATALWPARLNVLYPEVATLERFAADGPRGVALLAALLVGAAAAAARPRWRPVGLGLGWFVVALLPFNTAFPASSIAAADRYLYLAVPGLALAALAALGRAGRAGLALGALLLLPLGYRCGARAHDFADDQTLWRHSLAVDPDNAVARLNLAYDLLQRGPADLAAVRAEVEAAARAARYPIHEYRAQRLLAQLAAMVADYPAAAAAARAAVRAAAAQRDREVAPARRAEAEALLVAARLAAIEPLQLAGEAAAAATELAAVAAVAPDHPDVVAFLALRDLQPVGADLQARAARGEPAELPAADPRAAAALQRLATALQQHPQHAGLWCAQAAWLRATGQGFAALRDYRRALAADPQCVAAWLGAARLLRERETWVEAADYARRGLQQRPDPALRQELALALVGQGRLDDAVLQLEAYLRVRPEDRDAAKVLANVLIGLAYSRLDQPEQSRAEVLRLVEQALQHNPKEAKAHLVLGRLAREQRQFQKAAEHFATAHQLLPDFADARESYAQALADVGYERLLARDDDGAVAAWTRCLQVAPPEFATEAVRMQLQAIWRRSEQQGLDRRAAGDRAGAVVAFRRCLRIDPEQHWISWLLATTLHDQPDVDLPELEVWCRQAVAWQERHGLDRSQQVYLLARTVQRRGDAAAAQALAKAYLERPDADAKPQVIQALRQLAGD